MKTLGEAWTWYEHNRALLTMMKRLGERYWADLPWQGRLDRDDHFRMLDGIEVAGMARAVLDEFDDLAIFVLFSVFESVVRRRVAEDLQSEVEGLKHPALQRTAQGMLRNIAEGGFYHNVLDLYKRDGKDPQNWAINPSIEQVNRVRRYRNRVAHGRKEADRPDPMKPRQAYDALRDFLAVIVPDAP